MSKPIQNQGMTPSLLRSKKGVSPIVCLTAYSTQMAKTLDPHVDMLLVGDSLGMVLYGFKTTIGVTLDMMIAHGAAVTRGVRNACVIVDLPFGSYEESPAKAFNSSARVMRKTGCSGVKLEGGSEMVETVKYLTSRGIPVLGHVGLMPQSVHASGGFRTHGKSDEEAERIRSDAIGIAEAGAFAIVIEGTVESVASQITADVGVPTIGIGASPACDGQVLVTDDLLGLFSDFTPRFVKKYAELEETISEAAASYADDVRHRRFPAKEHCVDSGPNL